MTFQKHGIPEVPHDLTDPRTLRNHLQQMRNALVSLQGSLSPASAPTSFRVTPIAGGNVIDFERSDGDQYILLAGSSPNQSAASPIDMGLASRYTDSVGQASVKRYYWMLARKNGVPSKTVGPVAETTLALNSGASVPAPPPISIYPVTSDETGRITDPVKRLVP